MLSKLHGHVGLLGKSWKGKSQTSMGRGAASGTTSLVGSEDTWGWSYLVLSQPWAGAALPRDLGVSWPSPGVVTLQLPACVCAAALLCWGLA